MSFPRYESYKDSGVEWLGEVPDSWGITSLKRGYDVRLGKMLQTESSSKEDELLPYLRAANIQWAGIDVSDIKLMWFSKHERVQLTLLSGDLLISEGGDVGRSAIWSGEIDNCHFQNSVNRVRAREDNYNRYLYYWISVIKDKGYIDVLCNKSTIAHFTAEKVQAVPVPFPTPIEQQIIAAFLDRETAKIDALIAEQQRLIALLKEKRQAVISHAVTKGLSRLAPSPQPLSHEGRGANAEALANRNHLSLTAATELPSPCGGGVGGEGVPMKDSGIAWLGEVPAHWIVCALNYRYEIALGKMLDEKRITGNHLGPYLRNVDVQWGRINIENLPEMDFSGDDLTRYSLEKGDLLVCEGGEVGRAAIWNAEIQECFYQKALHRLRARDSSADQPCFLFWVLNAAAQLGIFAGFEGKATINHLTAETFRRYMFAFPPSDEQSSIAVFLNEETTKLDTLTAEAQRGIALLKERRSALISAAVTGKIDVRQLEQTLGEH